MTILQTLRRWFRRWNNGHKESGDIDVAYLIIMTFPLHTTLHIYLASNWAGGTIQRMSVTNIKALNLCRYIFVREGSRTVWTQGGGEGGCNVNIQCWLVVLKFHISRLSIQFLQFLLWPVAGGWVNKERFLHPLVTAAAAAANMVISCRHRGQSRPEQHGTQGVILHFSYVTSCLPVM